MGYESGFPHLGFNPAPGDLTELQALVAAVGKVTGEGQSAHTEVTKIGQSDGIWVGKAANKFSESVVEIPPYLKKALGSLDQAHRALSSWQTSLADFQRRARRLEEEAAQAASKVSSAQGAVDGLPTKTTDMSDKEKDDHEKDKKAKNAALTSANGELEGVRSRAHSLHGEFNTEANDAARRIKEASDDAPPKPNWFESALNDLGKILENAFKSITDPEFWKAIGDFLADAAMVIGILAMLGVPGLGWIGLAVAAGALLAHTGAMLGGAEGVTWQTLAWDAAGLFAGARALKGMRLAGKGKGVLGAGNYVKSLGQANVKAGRMLQSTRGFKAQLSAFSKNPLKWKQSFKNLGAGARNSLDAFKEMRTGYRQIARGDRLINQGNNMISRGTLADKRWTRGGVALAGGSNLNSGRWLNTDFSVAEDAPFVSSGNKIWDFVDPDRDFSKPVASSGSTFNGGLQAPASGATA